MIPGLYKDSKLINTWEELIEVGDIYVSSNGKELKEIDIRTHVNANKLVLDNKIETISNELNFGPVKTIYIGKNIESIALNSFSNSTLQNIEVHPENKNFTDKDGILFSKDMSALVQYPPYKMDIIYRIPDSVINIGVRAFSHNKYLEKIIFGKNVEQIQLAGFTSAKKLTTVILNDKIKCINSFAFSNCSNLKSINIPKNVEKFGFNLFAGSNNLILNYGGTEKDFMNINGWGYAYGETKLKEIRFQKTLDQLLDDGYNLRDANKILREYEIKYDEIDKGR